MQSWHFHNQSIIRYDPMDTEAPLARITQAWPRQGEQHFDIRLYPNGHTNNETQTERRPNLAEAVTLAEQWLPSTG